MCTRHAIHSWQQIQPNFKLKTQLKLLVGYLPLHSIIKREQKYKTWEKYKRISFMTRSCSNETRPTLITLLELISSIFKPHFTSSMICNTNTDTISWASLSWQRMLFLQRKKYSSVKTLPTWVELWTLHMSMNAIILQKYNNLMLQKEITQGPYHKTY